MKRYRPALGMLLSALLVVAGIALLAMNWPPRLISVLSFNPAPTVVVASNSSTRINSPDQEQALEALYKRASPAVVNISVMLAEDPQGMSGGMAQGSGFLYDEKGRIVTNNHVVDGATQIEVNFSDGTIEEAKVLGVDSDSDLAVIQIPSVPAGVQPLPVGDSDALEVGQSVAAIGNPFGLEDTLTFGIVSAKGRVMPSGLSQYSIPEVIQTDAAINPGNSGGPLLNLAGEVVGINTQIKMDGTSITNSGIGFAVPSKVISQVVPDLIANGKHAWPWLGVVGRDADPGLWQSHGTGGLPGRLYRPGNAGRAGGKGRHERVDAPCRGARSGFKYRW